MTGSIDEGAAHWIAYPLRRVAHIPAVQEERQATSLGPSCRVLAVSLGFSVRRCLLSRYP
jgi:hypothetical protein